MKTTIGALAAVVLLTAPHAYGRDAEPGQAAKLPGSKNAKVTQVYQHAIAGVPGKSIKGVLVVRTKGGAGS